MPAARNGCPMTPKSFTNASIKPLRVNKPHIVFIDGYWRVSKLPHMVYMRPTLLNRWIRAHDYVGAENNKLAFKELVACL